MRILLRLYFSLAVLVAGAIPAAVIAAPNRLHAGFGSRGLTSLKHDGKEILKDGNPTVELVVLERRQWKDPYYDYQWERLKGAEARVAAGRGGRQVIHTFSWGKVTFVYEPQADRLGLTVTIENTSDRTIADFRIRPLQLELPEPVETPKRWRRMVSLPDHPGVVAAKYGNQEVLLCAETMGYFKVGFGKPQNKKRELPVLLSGGLHMMPPGGVHYPLLGLPRVGPKQSLTVKISLRFAAAEADNRPLVADVHEAFRRYHQPRLVWKDRRPIGAIFLPTSKGPVNNPRNWFKDKKLDVRTDAGKQELRRRFMDFADRCIKVLKGVNAQGMIVWDAEGGENPHPITYIGDPRMVKVLAPEMEEIYPAFFKKFRDAGLRVGCCLRPTQVYFNKKTKKWAHGTGSHDAKGRNPLNDDYSRLHPKGLPWWQFFPVAERLSRKIDYAKKHWGCTIFYVDTNGVHRQVGEERKTKWTLLQSSVWREVIERHPDVLLIPEFAPAPAQLAYASVYLQPPYSSAITRDAWRELLPGAFSVSYTVNLKPQDWEKRRSQLLKGIRAGDSMFFRGWFGDHYNKKIKALYDEAYKPGAVNPGLPAAYKRGVSRPRHRQEQSPLPQAAPAGGNGINGRVPGSGSAAQNAAVADNPAAGNKHLYWLVGGALVLFMLIVIVLLLNRPRSRPSYLNHR